MRSIITSSLVQFSRGIAFILLETVRQKCLDVPIALYETFVIEEKYGFNKKSLGTFFQDILFESLLYLFFVPAVLYGYL